MKKTSLFYQMTVPSYASICPWWLTYIVQTVSLTMSELIHREKSLPVSGLMYMRKVSLTTSQRLPQCVER
jgi:hypothetical protein